MPLVPQHIQDLVPYKAGKAIQDLKREYKPKKIVKLASNENPIGPSPLAIKAMQKSLNMCYMFLYNVLVS